MSELAMEFLRRVVNELGDRKFEYCEEPWTEGAREFLTVVIKVQDFLKVLPDVTREFAARIKPEFTRCHPLAPPPRPFDHYYTARDKIRGLSIRCLRHWDVTQRDFVYRFDAALS